MDHARPGSTGGGGHHSEGDAGEEYYPNANTYNRFMDLVALQELRQIAERLRFATNRDSSTILIILETLLLQLVANYEEEIDPDSELYKSEIFGLDLTILNIIRKYGTNVDICVAGLKCLAALVPNFACPAKNLVNGGFLDLAGTTVQSFEAIELVEATIQCLVALSKKAPEACALPSLWNALLLRLSFFDSGTQAQVIGAITQTADRASNKFIQEIWDVLVAAFESCINSMEPSTVLLQSFMRFLSLVCRKLPSAIGSISNDTVGAVVRTCQGTSDDEVFENGLLCLLPLAAQRPICADQVLSICVDRLEHLLGKGLIMGLQDRTIVHFIILKLAQVFTAPLNCQASLVKLVPELDSAAGLGTPLFCSHTERLKACLGRALAEVPFTRLERLLIYLILRACGVTEATTVLDDMVNYIIDAAPTRGLMVMAIFITICPRYCLPADRLAQIQSKYSIGPVTNPSDLAFVLSDLMGLELFEGNLEVAGRHLVQKCKRAFVIDGPEASAKSAYCLLQGSTDEASSPQCLRQFQNLIASEFGPVRNFTPTTSHPLEILHKLNRRFNLVIEMDIPDFGFRQITCEARTSFSLDIIMVAILNQGRNSIFDAEVVRNVADQEARSTNLLKVVDWKLFRASVAEIAEVDPFMPLFAAMAGDAVQMASRLARQGATIIISKRLAHAPAGNPQSPTDILPPAIISCIQTIEQQVHSQPYPRPEHPKLCRALYTLLCDPVLVGSRQMLTDWGALIKAAPFLFDLETKLLYTCATRFGFSRYLEKLQTILPPLKQKGHQDRPDRMPRMKLVVSRSELLENARYLMHHFGPIFSASLEYQFTGDVGAGLGPTLEFYSLLSRELQRPDLAMWMDDGQAKQDGLVNWPQGLYPSYTTKEGPQDSLDLFKTLGTLVARCILDSRIMELPLNQTFVEAIFGRRPSLSLHSLAQVDASLANALGKLDGEPDRVLQGLNFTLPGNEEILLCPGGDHRPLNSDNFVEYLDLLLAHILERALLPSVGAFVEGFEQVLPVRTFQIFTAQEFLKLINGEMKAWEPEEILGAIKCDHGYKPDSPQIGWLIETFCEFDAEDRQMLVQFLTGASNLPMGGWKGLRPRLTIVCRTAEGDPDCSLPSVMTCANYLKLPPYNSKSVLRRRLQQAIREGRGSFLLS